MIPNVEGHITVSDAVKEVLRPDVDATVVFSPRNLNSATSRQLDDGISKLALALKTAVGHTWEKMQVDSAEYRTAEEIRQHYKKLPPLPEDPIARISAMPLGKVKQMFCDVARHVV